MNSPLHPDVSLQPREITLGLAAYHCPKSGGYLLDKVEESGKRPEA